MGNIPRSGFDDVELQNVNVKGVLKVGGVQITASAAEMNLIDGSIAGTSVASKVVVLGASKNTDILGLPVGGLKIGAAGAEVAVTASAAEINALTASAVTNADLVKLHAVTSSAAELNKLDDSLEIVQNIRTRVTLAEMNAGKTLLAAVAGKAYRIVDCSIIAIGGAAAATADATGIAIYGTQTAEVKLYEALLAALTQSAINKPGTANTNILADGASFVANDANTAITCKAVSAGAFDLITATDFDVNISYVMS